MTKYLSKIKDFLSDIKVWIGLIIFFIMGGVALAGWIKLPARVEKVEEKQEKTEDKVQEVAGTVDKFVMEQRVIREEENKREALMLELIKELKK